MPVSTSKNTTGYFTKEADSEEMGNTDEGIQDEERYIPQMVMRNFVKAIYEKCIPQELDNLLRSSARFRINSIKNQFIVFPNGVTQNIEIIRVSLTDLFWYRITTVLKMIWGTKRSIWWNFQQLRRNWSNQRTCTKKLSLTLLNMTQWAHFEKLRRKSQLIQNLNH